ncbi:MAG: tetratricopeptide repeat protein, partial [Elusimicrobia bacterium]|nr:tetratricopeptide repeat protein [Elusimicrobiota bacterium]
ALGRYDAAIRDAVEALRRNPAFAPGYGLLGAALAAKGDGRRALMAYDKAARIDPSYGYAALGKAALLMGEGRRAEAAALLDQAARLNPDDYEPFYDRAEAFLAQGNIEAALSDFGRALKAQNLTAPFALRIGARLLSLARWQDAQTAYSRAYDLESAAGQAGIEARLGRAQALVGSGDFKAALRELGEATAGESSPMSAWLAKGLLEQSLGRREDAFKDLSRAVQRAGSDPAASLARGRFLADSGQPSLALKDFDTALRLDPRNERAYAERGALLADALGEDERALADLGKAVELSPDAAQAAGARLSLAALLLKTRRYASALKLLNEAVRDGASGEALLARAEAWSRLGDQIDALRDVQAAQAKDPQDAGAPDELGLIAQRAHRDKEALRDFDAALRLAAGDARILTHRAASYGAQGRLSIARRDLEAALRADPRYVPALTLLCQAERLDGDAREAAARCDEALSLAPGDAAALLQRGLSELAARRYQETIGDVDAAARLGLPRAEGLLARSVANAALGRYKAAHGDYEAAARLDASARSPELVFGIPDAGGHGYLDAISALPSPSGASSQDPYAAILRADALENVGRSKQAAAECRKAILLDSSLPDAYRCRARSLSAQGLYDDAQSDLLKALELDPKNPAAHLQLAALLTLKGDYASAVSQAAQAIRLNPNDPEAYLLAGNARYFQQQAAKALANYTLAAAKGPESPSAQNGLGLGLFAAGRYPEAVEAFSRAIALNPLDDRFFKNRGSAYADMGSYANAAADFRRAGLLNCDPRRVGEYESLIDKAERRAEGR